MCVELESKENNVRFKFIVTIPVSPVFGGFFISGRFLICVEIIQGSVTSSLMRYSHIHTTGFECSLPAPNSVGRCESERIGKVHCEANKSASRPIHLLSSFNSCCKMSISH